MISDVTCLKQRKMLQLTLLGHLAVRKEDGAICPLKARKYGTLLAYLALRPRRAHAREELTECFWPDMDPEAARACLRTALASLRRTIPGDLFLDGPRETVQINPAVITTDVALFEQAVARQELTRAHELFAGPLLPGIYDDWVIAERERLDAVYEKLPHNTSRQGEYLSVSSCPALPIILLPSTRTRFWGRAKELTWLAEQLDDPQHRLITITGTGGIGKTRLATEAARQYAVRSRGCSVCFVSFADCSSANDLLPVIASTLQADGPGKPLERVVRKLQSYQSILLIFDNLEQLAEQGAGVMVTELLDRVPSLTLLATSRLPLRVSGERLLPLIGLTGDDDLDLFLDRARAVCPGFARTEQNAASLDALRKRLDGIPLALELCAAWAMTLSPSQICERLADRPNRMVNPLHDVPERHRSLHAALAWGPPLPPELDSLFPVLSVFSGGWTLEAAEAVVGTPSAETALDALLRRSLIVSEETEMTDGAGCSERRYRFLEPVRAFAAERLTTEGRFAARQRHLAWFGAFVRQAAEMDANGQTRIWFHRLNREEDNIRAAIEFAFMEGGDDELRIGLDIAGRLQWSWWVQGRHVETSKFVLSAFRSRRVGAPDVRVSLLLQVVPLLSDHKEAEACLKEALRILEEIGDSNGATSVLMLLAQCLEQTGQVDASLDLLEEVVNRRRLSGDPLGIVYARADQAGKCVETKRYPEAIRYLEEAIALGEEINNPASAAKCRIALAVALRETGDPVAAEANCRSALTVFLERGENWNIADALKGLGMALKAQKRLPEAREALTDSLTRFEELEVQWQVERIAIALAEIEGQLDRETHS